jgi:hypothetical protein
VGDKTRGELAFVNWLRPAFVGFGPFVEATSVGPFVGGRSLAGPSFVEATSVGPFVGGRFGGTFVHICSPGRRPRAHLNTLTPLFHIASKWVRLGGMRSITRRSAHS